MTNLLPDSAKRTLRFERRIRVATVALGAAVWTVIAGIVLLIPSYLLSETREQESDTRAALIQKIVTMRQAEGISERFQELQNAMSLLATEETEQSVFRLLDAVVAERPAAVSLTRFSVTIGAAGDVSVTVGGNAATRDALVVFRDRLKTLPRVMSVNLPLSNLAERADIDFSLSVNFVPPAGT